MRQGHRITISLSSYVYNNYIANYRGNNRSKMIEEFFIKGFDENLKNAESWKIQKLNLLSELDEIKKENRELKRQLSKYKQNEIEHIELDEKEKQFFIETIKIIQKDPTLINGRLNYYNNCFHIIKKGKKMKLEQFTKTINEIRSEIK